MGKKKHESEFRIILSRELGDSENFVDFGYESELYDYVSDRCFFDYKKNEFVEIRMTSTIEKLNNFAQNYDPEVPDEEMKIRLTSIMYEMIRLARIYPNVVLNTLDLILNVISMADEHLIVFMIHELKTYFMCNLFRVKLDRVKFKCSPILGGMGKKEYNKFREMFVWYERMIPAHNHGVFFKKE